MRESRLVVASEGFELREVDEFDGICPWHLSPNASGTL